MSVAPEALVSAMKGTLIAGFSFYGVVLTKRLLAINMK
jgi:hypothetical protein